jgi:hypothetical protein
MTLSSMSCRKRLLKMDKVKKELVQLKLEDLSKLEK